MPTRPTIRISLQHLVAIMLLAPVLGKSRARKLIDAVWGLEKVKDVRALRPLLQA